MKESKEVLSTMTVIRPPAVAGMFYPDNPQQLESDVRGLLAEAVKDGKQEGPTPKALIVPHAGYVYSGSTAAAAYARLLPLKEKIERVILLGPCHRVPVQGLALSGADSFRTPLGDIPLDKKTEKFIAAMPQVTTLDATHAQEHSLEVHLPFLQVTLGEFMLVPLVVGLATPKQVAEVLDAVWGGPETLIVISTDLSHFLDYDTAVSTDTRTKKAIEQLDGAAIGDHDACGRYPVKGMLALAKQRGMEISTVGFCNSGDTAGDKSRVVGYGAWVLTGGGNGSIGTKQPPTGEALSGIEAEAAKARALLDQHGEELLRLAASSILNGLDENKPLKVALEDQPAALRKNGAVFVTLEKNGKLRGCIGTLEAYRPLAEDVAEHAFDSGFHDHRFSPLTRDELDELSISISVLSPFVPFSIANEADLLRQLRPGIDGLIIQQGHRRALFLPQVWEQLKEPPLFLAHLKHKAGLDPNKPAEGLKAWRFITEGVKTSELDDPHSVWQLNG